MHRTLSLALLAGIALFEWAGITPDVERASALRRAHVTAASGVRLADKADLHVAGRRPLWATVSLADWDHDADGHVGWVEWRRGLSRMRLFAKWDSNGDGVLEPAEVGNGLFAALDLDEDGRVGVVELRVVGPAWLGSAEVFGTHAALDLDDDGGLDRDELDRGVLRGGLLDRWDRDADRFVDETELARALLGNWDLDQDGILSPTERPDVPTRGPRLLGLAPEP